MLYLSINSIVSVGISVPLKDEYFLHLFIALGLLSRAALPVTKTLTAK
jgi:hypothetical protein